MKTGKLNLKALGYAGGLISAGCMLLLSILGNAGIYIGAVEMMKEVHMFFSLSLVGIISGMIEAAIIGFVTLYAFGWVYNKYV